MAWFVDEERPLPALVLDGLGWGTTVGFTVGLFGGVAGIVVGTLLGAGLGLLVGFVAGVVLAGCQRVGASRAVAAVGTVLLALGVPALVPWLLWDVPVPLTMLWLGIPAGGPLTADVVWRVRRWRPRRRGRRDPRCVVVVGPVTLVVR